MSDSTNSLTNESSSDANKEVFDPFVLADSLGDSFVKYITGSTPITRSDDFVKICNELKPSDVGHFNNVLHLAACTHRKIVMDYLKRPECASVDYFIRNNYYMNTSVNFSALNLMGHCVIAATGQSANKNLNVWRRRCGSMNIWECDLEKANFSPEQKKILKEKITRFSLKDAKVSGNVIKVCLVARSEDKVVTPELIHSILIPDTEEKEKE